MNRRFPSADQPLNYEHVLFNHLECMSFFVAQGTADLKQMIEIYEQYVIPQTNDKERLLLARFKLVMSDLRDLVEEYYEEKIEKAKNADKPEAEMELLKEERDETLDRLDDVYYKILLRFLIAVTKRWQDDQKEVFYKEHELWRDLKIELRDVLPFGISVVDEVIRYYAEDGCEDTTGDQEEETLEVEQ